MEEGFGVGNSHIVILTCPLCNWCCQLQQKRVSLPFCVLLREREKKTGHKRRCKIRENSKLRVFFWCQVPPTASCVACPKILKQSVSRLRISGKLTLKQVRTNYTHRCCLIDLAHICTLHHLLHYLPWLIFGSDCECTLVFLPFFGSFGLWIWQTPWQFILSGPEKNPRNLKKGCLVRRMVSNINTFKA